MTELPPVASEFFAALRGPLAGAAVEMMDAVDAAQRSNSPALALDARLKALLAANAGHLAELSSWLVSPDARSLADVARVTPLLGGWIEAVHEMSRGASPSDAFNLVIQRGNKPFDPTLHAALPPKKRRGRPAERPLFLVIDVHPERLKAVLKRIPEIKKLAAAQLDALVHELCEVAPRILVMSASLAPRNLLPRAAQAHVPRAAAGNRKKHEIAALLAQCAVSLAKQTGVTSELRVARPGLKEADGREVETLPLKVARAVLTVAANSVGAGVLAQGKTKPYVASFRGLVREANTHLTELRAGRRLWF